MVKLKINFIKKFYVAQLPLILFSFFLLFPSCGLDLINDPTCTDKRSVINREIIPSFTIKYSDNVEYIGWFDFNIY